MTTDDRLFSLIRRISAIESQMVTRRSFLGSTDAVGARYYRELDVRLGYGTPGTAMGENRADVSTPDAGRLRRPGGAGARSTRRRGRGSPGAGAEVRRLGELLGGLLGKRGGTE